MAEPKSKKTVATKKLKTKFKGKGQRKCRFCGNARGLIRKYSLCICRKCFRDMGEEIGFRKF